MSFLDEINNKKNKLKKTETVVTNVDGKRFIEKDNEKETICPSTYGFVVDTKPDDTPILITDFLYIGSQDCATNDILKKYDIKNVLSLGIDMEVNTNKKFVECLDLPETDIRPVLIECLPFIRTSVEDRENILVHCNAGVSRTKSIEILSRIPQILSGTCWPLLRNNVQTAVYA